MDDVVTPSVDGGAPTRDAAPPSEAELLEARRALDTLARCIQAHGRASSRTRAEWAEVVAGCQGLVNTATAIQDAAIARVAAVEEEWLEDGTVVESRRALGHVALDAPDVVAGPLCVSHAYAQRRVVHATRLVGAGGARAGSEPDGSDAVSGLGALHAAMLEGRLDGYRAGVIVDELEEAPLEVAAAVVAALQGHLGDETATQLRRRCRRVLTRISPDLLRRRAQRARKECGLRRWPEGPGVDHWEGTFPSEDAALGWAAVDALARRYVSEGVCDGIEAARGRALIDLVTGSATIDAEVVVTVPATSDPVERAEPSDADGAPDSATPERPAQHAEGTGPVGPADPVADPGLARSPLGRSPGDPEALDPGPSPDDLVEILGPLPGDPVLVRREWLEALIRGAMTRNAPCDPATGALLDPTGRVASTYRPSARVAALVRTRDGRCRFPGCSVAARFCDLDHVRPWPTGPTSDRNIMCLCRRHHRIKQRPGWRVRLHPDGTAVWTDPTGRRRMTAPRNLLDLVVLRSRSPTVTAPATPVPGDERAKGTASGSPTGATGPVSDLETVLEVLGGHDDLRPRTPGPSSVRVGGTAGSRRGPGGVWRGPRVQLLRIAPPPRPDATGCRSYTYTAPPGHRRHHHPGRRGGRAAVDPPPF
ncbi:hypothetical protein GCM10023168_12800 [Fodinibacter luteus]|uniref:HNH nuclease domain-containing protein n=1 Tax=Fodinibacter luteus TaxID=552064 RepID=A0ABP8K9D6_9MICO